MISRQAFSQGMGILADRYGRALQPPTQAVYYSRLSAELNDAQFLAGVQLALDAPFLPSPADIIKAAKPAQDFKIEAEDAWNAILGECRKTPFQFIPYDRFSSVWHKAIGAAGGIRAIALAEPEDAPHVHRKFVEHYTLVQADRVAHERASVAIEAMDPRARALVGDTANRIGGSHA